MKEDKKETGEELLDIDEKGNPIKDQKKEGKEKKAKITHKNYFHYNCLSNPFSVLLFHFYQ